jgi:1-deoxy-D-xylulose-5-phosphate reductoisomerase
MTGYALCLAAAGLVAIGLPARRQVLQGGFGRGVRQLVGQAPLWLFMGGALLIGLTFQASISFFPLRLQTLGAGTALVGYAGLRPTLAAIAAGKHIALANKETLVVAGELVTKAAQEKGVNIYPVDSEHSAIFQCLAGEWHNPIEKIVLTASGGPFRGRTRAELATVTKAQALKHPNWDMGAKITIDSASLMNKGLEAIEAKWLFDLKKEQIEIIVHPQSIIHSIVQFPDGSMKAQMGLPDMKLPIQYAMAYPDRLPTTWPRFDFAQYASLTFEQPDLTTFRNLALALDAMDKGGNAPCVLNAANEVAVELFLKDAIGFLEMSDLVAYCLATVAHITNPTLADLESSDAEARRVARERTTPVWRS